MRVIWWEISKEPANLFHRSYWIWPIRYENISIEIWMMTSVCRVRGSTKVGTMSVSLVKKYLKIWEWKWDRDWGAILKFRRWWIGKSLHIRIALVNEVLSMVFHDDMFQDWVLKLIVFPRWKPHSMHNTNECLCRLEWMGANIHIPNESGKQQWKKTYPNKLDGRNLDGTEMKYSMDLLILFSV